MLVKGWASPGWRRAGLFGALLSSRSRASRNTFDRKIADFVVCDKTFDWSP